MTFESAEGDFSVNDQLLSPAIIDPRTGAVVAGLRQPSDAKLIICKDWRWMDTSDLTNLFLVKIDRVNDFYVFGYRWSGASKRSSAWSRIQHLVRLVISELDLSPEISGFVTVAVAGKRLLISLPNREFLNHHNASAIPSRLCHALNAEMEPSPTV